MSNRTVTRLATLLSTTACLAAAGMLPASAAAAGGGGGGGGASSFGACSGDINTTWTLTAEPSGSKIKVEAEVFAFLKETWKWTLTDNGHRVAKGTGITDKEHQDRLYFNVRRSIADLPGSDVIVYNATEVDTGQVCNGQVTL